MSNVITWNPNAESVQLLLASSASRPEMQWVNGQRTANPKTDDQGRALHAFDAFCQVGDSDLGICKIVSPLALPAGVRTGTAILPVGSVQVAVRNVRDRFDLGVTVSVEQYKIAGPAVERKH